MIEIRSHCLTKGMGLISIESLAVHGNKDNFYIFPCIKDTYCLQACSKRVQRLGTDCDMVQTIS